MSDDTQDAALSADATADAVVDAGEAQLSEVEQIASEMGWRPDGPKTAAEFIRRPGSKELRKEVKVLKDTIERMAAASTKQTERALQKQAEELNVRFNEAVQNQDSKAAAEAVKEMRELEQEASNSRPKTRDYAAEFAEENPWFGKDEDATAYAQAVSERLHAKGRPPEEQLEEAAKAVRKRFPELFDDPAALDAPKTPLLNQPGRKTITPKAKGFSDLPAAVKSAAEKHAMLSKERFGVDPEKSKADYARDYWADQA